MLKRSHDCGNLTASHIGQEVTLSGWVDRYRDHGGLVFIDLRDREGIAQVVFDPKEMSVEEASHLRQEAVISVKGLVRARPEGMVNKNIPTGEVEIVAKKLEVLNRSVPLPFSIHEDSPTMGEVDETLRLEYRYLDLRRAELQKNIKTRHLFLKAAREFYYSQDFWEIETPILYKSTPEGARDYLVPSRIYAGQFYALPQSPQTLKQLCMVAGFDKYVQIAKCFRDEDLRADRQPEFTQIDVEMSFIEQEDILSLHERLMQYVLQKVLGKEIAIPFQRMSYSDAIRRFGSDKPDLRNSLELIELSAQGKKSSFNVYQTELAKGNILKGLCFEEKEALPRSELDNLLKKVAPLGAKGITWIRIKSPGDWQSPQAKFFEGPLKTEIENLLPYKKNAMLFLLCGESTIVNNALGFLRNEYGERFGYIKKETHEFLWVTDFPLFEYHEEDKRLYAAHHPFTSPQVEDLDRFLTANSQSELLGVRAQAYDLVWNGFEIGGGSLRIYDSKVQSRMFEILGLTKEEAEQKFGFFIRALQFGTPPHGGIALGVDRIAMLLAGVSAIRDVIAFPKTQKAACLMSHAPSPVNADQLKELHLRVQLE